MELVNYEKCRHLYPLSVLSCALGAERALGGGVLGVSRDLRRSAQLLGGARQLLVQLSDLLLQLALLHALPVIGCKIRHKMMLENSE